MRSAPQLNPCRESFDLFPRLIPHRRGRGDAQRDGACGPGPRRLPRLDRPGARARPSPALL
eukprot:5226808-Pyramimonas_sp.AAC.1